MTREDKIKALEAIKQGTPARYVLREIMFLYRKLGETVWRTSWNKNAEVITEEEREKYFPSAICIEDVSNGENGEPDDEDYSL
jgi:hypothetical protein